ncbi:MAG: hypothetical protein ACI36Z_10045 [Alloprevotella sp.]
MTFYEIVEQWAERYVKMQHVPEERGGNQRFFLTDTYMGMVDFMTNIHPDRSPCVVMESNQDGNINEGKDRINHTIYFMVRAEEMNDGRSALQAKLEAKEHMKKFLAWARSLVANNPDIPENRFDLNENIDYNTVGPFYDGWYGVYISISEVDNFNQCVLPNDYV